ncbi:MAG: hypothetical protein ACYC19_04920 [Acidimicrobiales bacterium]
MSDSFRSEGWAVRPSFVPHGVTSGVTLLGDEHALTQLSGDPQVAWQTPWSEISAMQLVRFSRSLALFATIDGVRYVWRTNRRDQYDEIANVVGAHGARIVRRRRRAGVVAVVAVVLLASLAGGIAAFFTSNPSTTTLSGLKAVNLKVDDLPSGFYATTGSLLNYLFSPPGKVYVATTTTAPAANSAWTQVATKFQQCMGVSAAKDRMFGEAGQQPAYQVSSPIFASTLHGGLEVGSTAQYYTTTTMVRKDTAEMTAKNFGSCLVASNAALILSGYTVHVPAVPTGESWRPVTFAKGFVRGGVTTLIQSGSATGATTTVPTTAPLHLVIAIVTSGHYEVTFGAIVAKWPAAKSLLSNIVNTLLTRITNSGSTAA